MTHIPDYITVFYGRSDADRAQLVDVIGAACSVLVDELFDDLHDAPGTLQPLGVDIVAGMAAVSELPRQWWPRLRGLHIRQLIIAAADLTRRLCLTDGPPMCLAEALLYDMVLDRIGMVAVECEVDLPENWRVILDDAFLDDEDHRTWPIPPSTASRTVTPAGRSA